MGSRRTSGTSVAAVSTLALLLAGCYSFSGGGGFPSHIQTIYVETFENATNRFDLDQQLFRELTDKLPRSLGLRPGARENADAVVRGRISSYVDQAQNYLPGQAGSVQVVQNQVQITIAVEIIDRVNNVILWESAGLSGRGEYRPDSQSDEVARRLAFENIVQQIVDGAQSQW